MTKIGILILLSAAYGLVSALTGLAVLGARPLVGAWGPRLWPIVVPFAFGWLASAICRSRVARLPLLLFLAPAVDYSCAVLAGVLLGRAGDPAGLSGHLLRLGPHMLFAGAGGLAWSLRRSRVRSQK